MGFLGYNTIQNMFHFNTESKVFKSYFIQSLSLILTNKLDDYFQSLLTTLKYGGFFSSSSSSLGQQRCKKTTFRRRKSNQAVYVNTLTSSGLSFFVLLGKFIMCVFEREGENVCVCVWVCVSVCVNVSPCVFVRERERGRERICESEFVSV